MRRFPAAVLLFMTACGSEVPEEPRDEVQVLDSADVEIVRNDQPDSVLPLQERLRIGVAEGDPRYQFHRIRTIAVGPDGGFWVVDYHETVRHYGPNGEYVGSVGGAGEGPGEARGYGNAWSGEEEVLVFGYPGTLQQFRRDGALIDSRPSSPDGGGYVTPIGFSDGRWVLGLERTPADAGEIFRREMEVVLVDTVSDSLVPVMRFIGQLRSARGGRRSFFYGNPSLAVDGQGNLVVSDTLAYRIEQYALDGALTRVVERSTAPRPYDEEVVAEVEAGVEEFLRHGPFGDRDPDLPVDQDELRELVEEWLPATPPDHMPFIEDLLVALDGTLWVERGDRHPRPGMRAVAHGTGFVRWGWRPEWIAERVFDVFSPAGRYVGTASFPEEYAPMAASHDQVYGVWYDELGVEYVVVYALDG